jgi:hypothetical protein
VVSRDRSVFNFGVKQSNKSGTLILLVLPNREDGSITNPQNVGNDIPEDTANIPVDLKFRWLLFNPLMPGGYFCNTGFNNKKFCILPTECASESRVFSKQKAIFLHTHTHTHKINSLVFITLKERVY